mgnify:CR=1 FL=1
MVRRVSADFLLTGLVDGENVQLYRIVSDHDSLSVDANNVSARVECRIELQDGGTSVPVTAFWSVEVKAREEVLDTYEFSDSRQSIDYALPNGPFDQYGKFGRATHLIVIAYSDETREQELARKAFPLNREHPQCFPRTDPWNNTLTYRNGEYLLCSSYEEVDGVLLEGDEAVYLWNNPVPGNSSVSPGEDVVKNPRSTSWQKHSKWPILMTEAFMSNFAKLGSAVFSGDYMLSQHGKDAAGVDTVDYRKFDESQIGKPDCAFTPNILLNLLSGMAMFANGNAKFNPDGTVELIGKLTAEDKVNKTRIVIDPNENGVKMYAGNKDTPVADLSFEKDAYNLPYPNLKMNTETPYGRKYDIMVDPRTIIMKEQKPNGEINEIDLSVAGFYMPKTSHIRMPGLLFCGHFRGDGSRDYLWGDGAGEVQCRLEGTGTYIVTHKLNTREYYVAITPVQLHAFATLQGKEPNSFSFTIADRNKGLQNLEFDMIIFGRPYL